VEIENRFNSERSTLPPLFIVTPETRSGTVWTKSAPSSQILFRLTQLASASLQTVDKELLSNENFDFKVEHIDTKLKDCAHQNFLIGHFPHANEHL
jgi:Nrap protein PAP/OAS1-like domain 5